jgi:hypothetical protein
VTSPVFKGETGREYLGSNNILKKGTFVGDLYSFSERNRGVSLVLSFVG